MKKRSLVSVFFVVSVIFFLNVVSAGIYFSGLTNTYNLGEMITVDITVDPIIEGRLIKTTLFCSEVNVLAFNNYPDELGKTVVKLPLNAHTINQVEGTCYFLSEYGGDTRKSDQFDISRRLNVVLHSESFFANPGEEIVVSGSVKRMNGDVVNGEVEVQIPLLQAAVVAPMETTEDAATDDEETDTGVTDETSDTDTETTDTAVDASVQTSKHYGKVDQGEFSVPILLADDTGAGNYRMDVFVYETIAGEKASGGAAIASVQVFQILKSVDVALNKQNFNSGETLEFKPVALDQSGTAIEEDISVIIWDKDGNRVFENIVKSEETVSYALPTDTVAGYYEIEAKSNELNVLKKFYVAEKAIISFTLNEQTVTVTNIGNIPYHKDIEVGLNDKTFVKRIDLELGESEQFKLTGYNDLYTVKITDGETELNQAGVMLTGYALRVDPVSGGRSFLFMKNPIIWIFLAVIIVLVVLFLLRSRFKKKSYAYYGEQSSGMNSSSAVKTMSSMPVSSQEKKIDPAIIYTPGPARAEQGMVSTGKREKAAVMILKIKNSIGRETRQHIEKAVESIYEKKGAVYEHANFIYAIFTPLMGGNGSIELTAAKTAEQIFEVLKEYNRKFREKIEFGIGIHTGEIIGSVEHKKLKFTALGNSVILAKKLADIADKKILISKEAYEKTVGLKADKFSEGSVDYYEVKQIVDHEKSKKFIDDFLKREGKLR